MLIWHFPWYKGQGPEFTLFPLLGTQLPVLEASSAMVWLWDVRSGCCQRAWGRAGSCPPFTRELHFSSNSCLWSSPEFGCSYACAWMCIPLIQTWPAGWIPSLTWAPLHHDGLIWRPPLSLLCSSTGSRGTGPLSAWTLSHPASLPPSALGSPSPWGSQSLLLPNKKIISPNEVIRWEISLKQNEVHFKNIITLQSSVPQYITKTKGIKKSSLERSFWAQEH